MEDAFRMGQLPRKSLIELDLSVELSCCIDDAMKQDSKLFSRTRRHEKRQTASSGAGGSGLALARRAARFGLERDGA